MGVPIGPEQHTLDARFTRRSAEARLTKMADVLHLSREAKLRLAWLRYAARTSVSAAARHFGIARRTLHAWQRRFDPKNLATLESRSRAPAHVRHWQVTAEEERHILALKQAHPRWRKAKLQVLYRKAHGTDISLWAIQRVVTRHQAFPQPLRPARLARKRPAHAGTRSAEAHPGARPEAAAALPLAGRHGRPLPPRREALHPYGG
jgi:transposase